MKVIYLKTCLIRILYGTSAGIIFIILAALIQPATIVSAHAALTRSDPAANTVLPQPPDRVTIWFSEAVDAHFSSIKVLDSQGKEWDNADTAKYQNDPTAISVTLQKLPDGIYTVVWHNVSATDGHSLSDSYIFSIGVPLTAAVTGSAQTPLFQSPVEPFLHWIEMLGILAIVGSLFFELFITRPVIQTGYSAKPFQIMGRQTGFRTFMLVLCAGVAFLLASIAELVVKTSVAHRIPWYQAIGHAHFILQQTYWGTIWLWRAGLVVIMLITVAIIYPLQGVYRKPVWKDWRSIALCLSSGVLLTLCLVSHSAAIPQIQAPAAFNDFIHLMAASFWIGGIIYLVAAIPAAMRTYRLQMHDSGSETYCPAAHKKAFSKFSFLALISAGLLVITGLYDSWAQISVWNALITPYGITLLVKIGLIILFAAFGAANLMWVRPRLADDRRALVVLNKALNVQALLAVMVMLSVGTLVSLNPGRQAVSNQINPQMVTVKSKLDQANMTLQIKPCCVGSNNLVIYLRDQNGKAIDNATVGLSVNYKNSDIGSLLEYATPSGRGEYNLMMNLGVEGPWQADLTVERPGWFDANTSLDFNVRPQQTANAAIAAPSSAVGNLLWGIEIILIGLLFIPANWLSRRFENRRPNNS